MFRFKIFVGLFVVCFVVSCTSSQTELNSSTQELAQTQNFAGQKITFLTHDALFGAGQALATWFNEETGAVVEVRQVPYQDLLPATLDDFSSNTSTADVYMLWYINLGLLVEEGVLVDLTALVEQHRDILQPDDYIPTIYDSHTLYQGKRWALPYDGNIQVLFYRSSLLEKYNLAPPETWNEFLYISQTITERERDNGIYGSAIMGSPAPILTVSTFMNRLGSYGGKMLDEDGQPVINSVEAVNALTAMVDQAQYALPLPIETDFGVARDAFLLGQVAMVEQWTDIGIMAEDPAQSTIQGDWGVVQMPRGHGQNAQHASGLNAGFSLGISSKSSNRDLAEAFVIFASRPDITLRLNLNPPVNGGIDPTRISVLRSNQFREFAPQISQVEQTAYDNAVAWPTIPEAPQLMDVLSENIVAALDGFKTSQQALDDTQIRWREILDGR